MEKSYRQDGQKSPYILDHWTNFDSRRKYVDIWRCILRDASIPWHVCGPRDIFWKVLTSSATNRGDRTKGTIPTEALDQLQLDARHRLWYLHCRGQQAIHDYMCMTQNGFTSEYVDRLDRLWEGQYKRAQLNLWFLLFLLHFLPCRPFTDNQKHSVSWVSFQKLGRIAWHPTIACHVVRSWRFR